MKKILSMVCLTMGLLLVFSCNDDITNPYDKVSTISVDSANVLFDAPASTGKVVVTADNGITKAETNTDWCTVTYSGNVVTVSATQNNGYDGRASLVTIWSGDDYVQVTVQQMGTVFNLEGGNLIQLNDTAQSVFKTITKNVEVTVTSLTDWVTCSLSDKGVTVNVTENATGNVRFGYIRYTAGDNIVDTIKVVQADFEKDVLGNYDFIYYSDANYNGKDTLNAVLSKDKLTLPDLGYEFAATYNEQTNTFTIASGQAMGTETIGSNTYYLFNLYMSASYWTVYSGSPGVTLPIVYSEKDGVTATFTLTLSGEPMQAFIIGAFTTNSFDGSKYAGYWDRWYYPYIVKSN